MVHEIDLRSISRTQTVDLYQLLNEYDKRLKYDKLNCWFPDTGPYKRQLYQKAIDFFNAGAQYKERVLQGGNRCGKSTDGAYEAACHLTGLYPDWWKGMRFFEPTLVWACAKTFSKVIEIAQTFLLGPLNDLGSGMIPRHLLVGEPTPNRNVANCLLKHDIRHVSGGVSTVVFKSYTQGRGEFEGSAVHFVWLDEEPPVMIYTECLTRTISTGGRLIITYTPLDGLTQVVMSFCPHGLYPEDHIVPGTSKWITRIEWGDVPHIPDDEAEAMLNSYPPHEREARSKGIPCVGAGQVFTVPRSDFVIPPFEIPPHWLRFGGMDFGYSPNKTAIVWCAYDRETDTVYIYKDYKVGYQPPPIHGDAIRRQGKWIPLACDPSGNRAGDMKGGKSLIMEYREMGVKLYNAQNNIADSITVIYNRLATNRLKVFQNCNHFLEEYSIYRFDDNGNIARNQSDDVMDATRYAIMTGLRLGLPCPDEEDFGLMKTNGRSYFEDRSKITGC